MYVLTPTASREVNLFVTSRAMSPVTVSLCITTSAYSPIDALIFVDFWSRFVVKQTFEKLRLKRSFIQHSPTSPQPAKPSLPIHNSRSIEHGWEWYEMGFFVQWKPANVTIFCFDLPQPFQITVQKAFISTSEKADFSNPYAIFATIIYELLLVYDNSVWSIRNHICNL